MSKLVSSLNSKIRVLACVVATFTAFCAGSAWADPGWRATLTVGADAVASGVTLSDFPVLVRISESRIAGFDYDDCAADGSDLSFYDAEEENALDFEIDTWNPEGESPVVDAGTKLGWMTGARDVYGRDRCWGKQGKPDIGAAEAFTQGTMMLVK